MWISDIEVMILSKTKKYVFDKLNKKHPKMLFTTSDRYSDIPSFPVVMLRDVGSSERGNDLENTFINTYLCTVQVDVIDNVSQNNTKEIMRHVIDVMKKMSFSIASAPTTDNKDGTYRIVARFRREIGWDDVL